MALHSSTNQHQRWSSATPRDRSSLPQSASDEQRDDTVREDQKLFTTDGSHFSDNSSTEVSLVMEYTASDDDIPEDEESSLTARQRRRRWRRLKQQRELGAQVADSKALRSDIFRLKMADRNVLKRLLINAGLIVLWYLFSLSISIYNKWMFSEDVVVFPFPLFTTSLHMLIQFTLSSIILYIFPSFRSQRPQTFAAATAPKSESKSILTAYFYFTRLVPCGAATSLDIGLGNMSLKFISLTFLTMCKSSALAFVLLFAFVFRLETPSWKLVIIIATMTVGVIMMVAGEAAFNALGFALVIASAFFSGFRWGLTQILLLRHPATSNPFLTLFFLTPVMFSSLITIALIVEGVNEIAEGFRALTAAYGAVNGVLLLIFPGVLAFCMISSEFALLKRSSVVTLSICGIFKEVVTISAAGVVFHDKLTPINVSGLIVTISSIASYNYMKISKMRREAREDILDHSLDASDSEDPNLDGSRARDGYRSIRTRELDGMCAQRGSYVERAESQRPS